MPAADSRLTLTPDGRFLYSPSADLRDQESCLSALCLLATFLGLIVWLFF